MVDLNVALELIIANTPKAKIQLVTLEQALGCVIAQNIKTSFAIPPFNKSAMDGYAVKATDIKKNEFSLQCVGVLPAGKQWKRLIQKGKCIAIMTGASVPASVDTVIMKEDTQKKGSEILFSTKVTQGANICKKGEDIQKGDIIVATGSVIDPCVISAIASVGKDCVNVYKKPHVAVLNTGEEIVMPGNKRSLQGIYNSNGPTLMSLLQHDMIPATFLGIAKDTKTSLKKKIQQGLKKDILILSGGVSMGDYDLVPEVMKELGVKQIIHKVKIKPGKPLYFGKKGNCLVFGLPGNPVSTFLGYHLFVKTVISKRMNCPQSFLERRKGILQKEYTQKQGRLYFTMCTICTKENCYEVRPLSHHGSADIVSMQKANGFMIVDSTITKIKKGSIVEFVTWKNL